MKPALQEPSEMDYSQVQYVFTNFNPGGIKFSFKSIKCFYVQIWMIVHILNMLCKIPIWNLLK